MPRLFARDLRCFVRSDKGSSTVELVLWFPLLFAVFGLLIDAAMIYNGRSLVLSVVEDANRGYSVGVIGTEAQTETYVINRLVNLTPNVVVNTVKFSGVATTTAFVPASDLEFLGIYSALSNMTLAVRSQHFVEFF